MKMFPVALLFALFVSTVFPDESAWLCDIWEVKSVYQIVKEDSALSVKKQDKPYAFEFLSDKKGYMRIDGVRAGDAFGWEYQDGLLTIIQGSRKSSEQIDPINADLLMMYEQNATSSKAVMLILAREKRR